MTSSNLPISWFVLLVIVGSSAGAAAVQAVFRIIQHLLGARERFSLNLRQGLAELWEHLRRSLWRIMNVARNPEKPGVVKDMDWPNELSGADDMVSHSIAIGMPQQFTNGTRTLRRVIEAWQHRAESMPDLCSVIDLGKRRRRLLADKRYQSLTEWAEHADKEFRALCLIEGIMIRYGQSPLWLSREWRNRRKILGAIEALTREVDCTLRGLEEERREEGR